VERSFDQRVRLIMDIKRDYQEPEFRMKHERLTIKQPSTTASYHDYVTATATMI